MYGLSKSIVDALMYSTLHISPKVMTRLWLGQACCWELPGRDQTQRPFLRAQFGPVLSLSLCFFFFWLDHQTKTIESQGTIPLNFRFLSHLTPYLNFNRVSLVICAM